MTFCHLANLFYNWGHHVKPKDYLGFKNYLESMLKMNRVMVIYNGEYIVAVLCYYITNEYESLYKKHIWQVAEDNPNGNQIYIDKLLCKKWTRLMRRMVEEAIYEKYPNVEVAFYHREPYDRCVKINKRRYYELQT